MLDTGTNAIAVIILISGLGDDIEIVILNVYLYYYSFVFCLGEVIRLYNLSYISRSVYLSVFKSISK